MTKKSSNENANSLTEFDLVHSITGFLVSEDYKVRHEVSNMGQSIDIVATRGRWVTAIEAKKSNWKRAIQQCKAHTLVADYIVLALALKRIPSQLETILSENGWGLILLDNSLESWNWIIKPQINTKVWKPQRERFAVEFRKINYGN